MLSMHCDRAQRLKVVEIVSAPAAEINDDRAGYGGNLVWIIDGATDTPGDKLLPGASDAAWLAEKFHRHILARAEGYDGTLTALLEQVTRQVAQDFEAERLREPPSRGRHPAAAGLIVRLHEGAAEVLNAGDCQLFMAPPGEKGRLLGVDRRRLGDKGAISRIKRAVDEQGIDWHTARARTHEHSARSRRMMNLPGGYSVFSIDMPPPELLHQETIPVARGARLLLATDGFARLHEVFEVYSEESLLDAAFDKGLANLLAELRHLENRDPDCQAAPRIKSKDDASAILAVAE